MAAKIVCKLTNAVSVFSFIIIIISKLNKDYWQIAGIQTLNLPFLKAIN